MRLGQTWKVATWENTLGKLILGKIPLGKYLTYFYSNGGGPCSPFVIHDANF